MPGKKLTPDQIKDLIIDYNEGNGPDNGQLAEKYGVAKSTIVRTLTLEGIYKPQRTICKVSSIGLWEIKEMRYHNRMMKIALKKIRKFELNSDPSKAIEHLKYIASDALNKTTLPTILWEQQV